MKFIGIVLLLCLSALAIEGNKVNRLAARAKNANLGKFPYQVSIQKGGIHTCGGALISRIHVLTAAHCVNTFIAEQTDLYTKARQMVVEVGAVEIGRGRRHAIRRVSYHRQFNPSSSESRFMPNDIAVITLKTPVKENAYVKSVRLPKANAEVPVGSTVTISGYGSAVITGPTSSHLKYTDTFVTSKTECDNYYSTVLRKRITSSHICAKRGNGYGTCKGDSGGPLVYRNEIVGVVSGGDGRCGAGYPEIYTKVSHFISFIKYEMNYDFRKPQQFNGPKTELNFDASRSLTLDSNSYPEIQSFPGFDNQISQITIPQISNNPYVIRYPFPQIENDNLGYPLNYL